MNKFIAMEAFTFVLTRKKLRGAQMKSTNFSKLLATETEMKNGQW